MDKKEYTNKAAEILREKYSNYNFVLGTNEELLLTYDMSQEKNSPRSLYLNTPYYISERSQFVNIAEDILKFCENAFSINSDFSETAYEAVKDKILPQIKTKEQIDYVQKDASEEKHKLIATPLSENLIVAYVIDQQNGFLYLTRDYLEKWGLTPGEIDQVAMNNLLKNEVTQNGPNTLNTDEGKLFYIFESRDGFDASRILLSIIHSFFAKQMPEGYVIGIPHRDILICSAKSNSDEVQRITQELYKENPHPVFPGIFNFGGSSPN